MHVYEFRCPQCAARLRCRDRSWVGRRIQCPDCAATVVVASGRDGHLYAEAAVEQPPRSTDTASTAASVVDEVATGDQPMAGLEQIHPQRPWRERVLSPAGIGWMVAAGIALLLIGSFMLGTGGGNQQPGVSEQRQAVGDAEIDAAEHAGPVEASETLVEDRLLALSGWLNTFLDAEGEFPSAASHGGEIGPPESLSWQAVLVAAQPDQQDVRPQWDREWDDPLNDQFVRRRIDALLNPNLDQPTGMQGYPAAHFAGIAGVGVDAAELPKQHPRAGIFGNQRITTPDDVMDGLTNTMMVAGIEEDLTSWAAGGRGVVRSFVEEPYVNGPDGFGTGQGDGMHVLMADGSVRFVSNDIDPTIIRRMAAMADGLPLDSDVPGEPGDSASIEVVQIADADRPPEIPLPPDPFEGRGESELPIDVLLADDERLFDVAGALEFPVAEFVQTTPVSLLDMLYQWEEMAGVPIDATPLDAEPSAIDRLRQNVTLTLSDTTLGEILAKLLAQAGLRYDAGPNGVRLHFADPS